MKLSSEQKVKISIGIGVALLGAISLVAYWSVRQLHQIQRDYKHVDPVIHATQRLLFDLNDAQTRQRDYLLTGQKQYLEPCRLGIAATKQNLKELSILIGAQPQSVGDLNALQSLIQAKLAELEVAITLRQTKGLDAALKVVKHDRSKADTDAIRAVIQDIEKDIQQQQEVRESRVVDSIQAIALILASLGLFGLGSIGATVFAIFNNARPLLNAARTHPDGVTTTFSDITERQWAEEQVRLVQILALEIGTAKDLTSALQSVLEIVSQNRGFAYGEAWVPCPHDNVLKFETAWHLEVNAEDTALATCLNHFKTRSESLVLTLGTGLPGRVWRSKAPEWQRDISDAPDIFFPRVRVARDVGIKAAIGIPILVNQEVLAVLVFFKLEAVAQDELLIESLTTISAQLGLVLARKQMEDALAESEAELRALFEAMHDLVLIRDAEGRCLRVLSTHSENLVKPPEELLGKTLHETLPQKEADLLLGAIHQCLTFKKSVMCDCCLAIQGVPRWFSVNMSVLSTNAVMLVIRDITERKQLEQALYQEKELAQVTLHSIGDAVITTDAEGNIQYFNPVAEALTGWNQAQTCGLPLIQVFNIINETTREPVDNPVDRALRERRVVGLANHTLLICRDGREIPIEDSAAPIYDSSRNLIGAVLVFHDVTQARSLTKQLSWQASHDPLTQLANRREFERRIEKALLSAQTQEVCHGLCYLDLDQFKIVNDTCGHTAGDELLRQVTTLLHSNSHCD